MPTSTSGPAADPQRRTVPAPLVAQVVELFEHAPTFAAIVEGPEHVIIMTNPSYDALVKRRDLVGKTVREALPELVDQGFVALMDKVYATGQPFVGKEMAVCFEGHGQGPGTRHYRNFVYQPLHGSDGAVCGIFINGVDVTSAEEAEESSRDKSARLREIATKFAESESRQFAFLTALARDLANPESRIRYGIRSLRRAALTPEAETAADSLERQLAQLLRVVSLQLDGIRARRAEGETGIVD